MGCLKALMARALRGIFLARYLFGVSDAYPYIAILKEKSNRGSHEKGINYDRRAGRG